MSFVLSKKNPVVKWPVVIPVPMGDGNVKNHKVSFDFEIVSTSELLEKFPGSGGEIDMESQKKAEDFLVEKTHDWHDVVDEDKQPIEFTDEGFRKLLNLPFAGKHIQAAYLECLQGRKAKN
jgi:hypothetical protein